MAVARVQSVMKMTSGIPNDSVVNTWHYGALDVSAKGALAAAQWEAFMRDIAAIFPDTVATSGHDLRMYDLADPEPRAPFLETDWSFASTLSGTPLPSECAIVASYQGERVSGLPQRRRRGRMYLGPLDGNVLTSDGRITSIAYNSVNGAMEDFVNALEVDDITFGIWSTVDEQLVTVRSGWTDNAYDIQRRRGVLPTVRVTWLKD